MKAYVNIYSEESLLLCVLHIESCAHLISNCFSVHRVCIYTRIRNYAMFIDMFEFAQKRKNLYSKLNVFIFTPSI